MGAAALAVQNTERKVSCGPGEGRDQVRRGHWPSLVWRGKNKWSGSFRTEDWPTEKCLRVLVRPQSVGASKFDRRERPGQSHLALDTEPIGPLSITNAWAACL